MHTSSRISIRTIGVAAAVCALIALYLLVDPASAWWMPKCPVKWFTGYDCPGCGSQRAFHALLHGDVGAAFRHNALLLIIIPYIAVLAFAEFNRNRCRRLLRVLLHPAAVIAVLLLIGLWCVVRNIVPGVFSA